MVKRVSSAKRAGANVVTFGKSLTQRARRQVKTLGGTPALFQA